MMFFYEECEWPGGDTVFNYIDQYKRLYSFTRVDDSKVAAV
jgi:hypothetical protein